MPPPVVFVGKDQKYTSILRALKETPANQPLRILSGDYDIEEEYKEFYGDEFWINYDGYHEKKDYFMRGLWLADGRKVYGEAGTHIVFSYAGNNRNVFQNFSVFANGKNTTLENVEIFVNNNCRYFIHDDFKPSEGTVTWRNIIFHGNPHSSACIGGD